MTYDLTDYVLPKAEFPMLFKLLEKVNEVTLLQIVNAPSSIYITLGIEMLVSPLQDLNAEAPICVTELGITIPSRLIQPPFASGFGCVNVKAGIEVKLFDNVTDVNA